MFKRCGIFRLPLSNLKYNIIGRYHHDNRRQDNRRRDNSSNQRPVDNSFLRARSRSPEHRHRYERENRDRRHKDRVREFLKEDR